MSSVVAKFKVKAVTRTDHFGGSVILEVVTNSPENEKFFKYTPAGKIEMQIMNDSALETFTPGEEMLVHFEKVK